MWELTIVGDKSTITFEHKSTEVYNYPAMTFSITLNSYSFSGVIDAQYTISQLQEFLDELIKIEEVRQGEARLRYYADLPEVSPLRFGIYSINRMGHMAIDVELYDFTSMSNGIATRQLSVTFEIDPSELPKMVDAFRELLKEFD